MPTIPPVPAPATASTAQPTAAKRGRGRPRGPAASQPEKRGRPVERKQLRDGEARGRSGEILTRGRVSAHGYANEFEIPDRARDPKWDLMWARTAAHGKPDPANLNELYENGWRPASPKNYPSVMPDMKGRETIERDGLMLMERPMQLSQNALAEARQEALDLREIQTEAFGNRKLPKGFDKGGRSKDGKFDASKKLNRTLERAPSDAKPTYEYAGPGDDD